MKITNCYKNFITCIAIRFPIGCVNIPENIQPRGTHNKLIEPEIKKKIIILVKLRYL